MTPFTATLRSEWTKLVSLRSTKVTLALALLVGVALSALLAIVIGETFDDWPADELRDFDPIGSSLVGGIASAIFFLVLGVKSATNEYGSGMIRTTLTATPRRGRVLAAKAAVVGAVTLVAGLGGNLAMFGVSQLILASYGVPTVDLADGDVLRATLGNGALTPLFPVIALALGFVLRSTAAVVIGVFALIFAPAFLGGLLPAWWEQDVLPYLPGAASEAIAPLEGSPEGLLDPAVATLVVIAWLAVFLAGAGAALQRRDA